MNAPMKKAQFDRSAQHRRALYAKINIGRQQLGLCEDGYRQMLFDSTGQLSLRDCSEQQLEAMLALLRSKGFQPTPRGGAKRAAQHPVARKARALWISLHQLGVVHNPSEHALEAFAKRQLGCEKLVWAKQSHGHRLIEALKDMGAKKGWRFDDPATGKPASPATLKANLCEAILSRLKAHGVARMDWALHDAAWKLAGIANAKEHAWTASDYEQLAKALGGKLRAAIGEGGEA
jgi:phage gp16-like protein